MKLNFCCANKSYNLKKFSYASYVDTPPKNIPAVNPSSPEEYFWSTTLFWLEEQSFETGDCPVKKKPDQNIFLYSSLSSLNIISLLPKNK